MTTVTIEAQCECAERLMFFLQADLARPILNRDPAVIARIGQDLAELHAIHTTLKYGWRPTAMAAPACSQPASPEAAKMDSAQRTKLVATLLEIDQQIEAIKQPIRSQLDAIRALGDRWLDTLEAAGVHTSGKCEGCRAFVVTGDKAHAYEGGEYLCEACAPSYGDLQQAAQSDDTGFCVFDEDNPRADALKKINDHLAAGGKLTDKLVWVIE